MVVSFTIFWIERRNTGLIRRARSVLQRLSIAAISVFAWAPGCGSATRAGVKDGGPRGAH